MENSPFPYSYRPGMNRCSIPEEETTNALRALYHPVAPVNVPPTDVQDIQPYNSTVTSVGMTSADSRHPAPEHQDFSLPTSTISGKKKHGSAMAANSMDLDGPTNSSNSRKKNLGMLEKISKMNTVKNSPSGDAPGQLKSNDAKAEKMSQIGSSDKGIYIALCFLHFSVVKCTYGSYLL